MIGTAPPVACRPSLSPLYRSSSQTEICTIILLFERKFIHFKNNFIHDISTIMEEGRWCGQTQNLRKPGAFRSPNYPVHVVVAADQNDRSAGINDPPDGERTILSFHVFQPQTPICAPALPILPAAYTAHPGKVRRVSDRTAVHPVHLPHCHPAIHHKCNKHPGVGASTDHEKSRLRQKASHTSPSARCGPDDKTDDNSYRLWLSALSASPPDAPQLPSPQRARYTPMPFPAF